MAKMFGGLNVKPDKPPEEGATLPEALKGKSKDEMYEMLQAENKRLLDEEKAKQYDKLTAPPVAPTTPPPATPRASPPSTPQARSEGTKDTSYQQPQGQEIDPVMNPSGFMQQQLDQRIGPLVQTTVQSLRATNREVFKQGKDDFAKYEQEVEQFVDALHPQLQANPEAYKRAYDFVRSTHIDEIVAEQAKVSTAGALATALADVGMDQEQIAGVVAKMGGGPAAAPPPSASLFQPNVGLPPRVASTNTTPASAAPAARSTRKFSDGEKAMMEEFEMTPEEWEAERAQNTDLASSLRGE